MLAAEAIPVADMFSAIARPTKSEAEIKTPFIFGVPTVPVAAIPRAEIFAI
jgi:hypothetical protein